MQKITPFLWFDSNAEDAMNFYTSIFTDSGILYIRRYGKAGPGPEGSVMTAAFELMGQEFMVLNAGPVFKFTEAISFFVKCETQEEVDYFWEKLSQGGRKDQCGWLKDQFGLSWQIIPNVLGEYLGDANPAKSQAVMMAMMQMTKIDIAGLKQAYEQSI